MSIEMVTCKLVMAYFLVKVSGSVVNLTVTFDFRADRSCQVSAVSYGLLDSYYNRQTVVS